MSEDVAWAAGLFEGEGCFTMGYGKQGAPTIRAALGQRRRARFEELLAERNAYEERLPAIRAESSRRGHVTRRAVK